MKSGCGPTLLDLRDLSYHRSFGAIFPPQFPASFSLDHQGIFLNQNDIGMPFGCTGMTQADNASEEDHKQYDPRFTYERTCFMEDHPTNQGCDIRTSLKSTQVYGLAENAGEPYQNRRGRYFNIYDDGPTDWFDSIRLALMTHNVGVSVGTPWFAQWATPTNGILSMPIYSGKPFDYVWHNYAIKGWEVINGQPMLLCKAWQGKAYGNNGWVYMNRSVCNYVMSIRGSVAYVNIKATPADISTIRVSLLETALVYLKRILAKYSLVTPQLN